MELTLLFHLLIAFGALQALFLALILGTRKQEKATRLFALFLFIEGFTLIERLVAETGLMANLPHLLGISYPLNFIKSPMLLLLALLITQSHFKIRRVHLWHTFPFWLMLLMNVPFYLMTGEEKVEQVTAFIDYVPAYNSFNFWYFLSFFLYLGVYLYFSIKTLSYYCARIKTNPLANGYLRVLYLHSTLLLIQLLHFLLRPSGWVEFPFINEASMLLMTFLIQSIAYTFLTRSKFMEAQGKKFDPDLDQLTVDGQKIRTQFETEKSFLKDDLSLESFAEELDLSKNRVSEVINQSFGTSFKELLGKYRVEEAKRLMAEQNGQETSIIQIGLRAGFNNKVSFYRTFKKQTGKSPTEYFKDYSINS
ncbi:MAG: helix-turn-helix domain-containing protein [Cytophagales bacterium]|nr:helix-turn-helix domain-containing protein [Cytophagales bacterium]